MHEFFLENLRNPARNRRADLMRQFWSGQLDSIKLHMYIKLCENVSMMLNYHDILKPAATRVTQIDL